MSESAILEALITERIIAIVRQNAATAQELATVAGRLADAGVHVVEFPLTGDGAVEAIRLAGRYCPDSLVGAGTVLSTDDVDQVADAGARFVVAPGLDRAVVERAQERGMATFPGALTATEVQQALRLGVTAVKLFPAGPLGVGYVSAMLAPYSEARLIPTGGVTVAAAADYLRAGACAVGLGNDLIGDGTAEHIAEKVGEFRAGLDSIR